jgi:pimeloyl-ACP methyl ester carboxylesterase
MANILNPIDPRQEKRTMTRSTQPEVGTASVNGTQLYYEMLGEGHPLVLIHGGYMDRRMWDDQFYVFAEYYRVIRYDVRGFGKSELPPVSYAVSRRGHRH